jgi:putative NADH-flavin reductase
VNIVVLGATGGTGLQIVRQAIEHGHAATAFVRSPEKLRPFGDGVLVVQGDLLDGSGLERVLKGHDGVLSSFGPRVPISTEDAHLLERFANVLTSP